MTPDVLLTLRIAASTENILNTGSFGTLNAFGSHTQPPFGVDEQLLNEELTRCLVDPASAASPVIFNVQSPHVACPPKGFFMRAGLLTDGIQIRGLSIQAIVAFIVG